MDEVVTTADYYQIRTSTEASILTEASLRLRSTDFAAVQSTLQFRDHDRIEITELEEAENPIAGAPAVRMPAPAPTVETPVSRATAADELRVFAALRRLGADLGEPIEVMRSGDIIVVTALAPDAGRRRQIEQEIGSLAHVNLQFTDLAPATLPQPVASIPRAASGSAFETELNQFFGGRPALDRFTDQALEVSDAALARAHALRRLSEHFPAEVAATLSAEDRQLLRELAAVHATALANSVKTLDQLASPVLTSLKVAPAAGHEANPSPEAMLQSARQVEQLLAGLLTGSPTGLAAGEVPGQLRAVLTQLSNSADIYLASPPQ